MTGAEQCGMVQVDHEDALAQPVDGHHRHDRVGERVQHREEAEHAPVRQPLGVVVLLWNGLID